MRRPRKTPPLATWEGSHYAVALHKQKVGFVLWAYNKIEGDFEWSAFEDRQDAENAVREYYDLPTVN